MLAAFKFECCFIEQDVHDWPCKVLTVNNKNYYMMKELGVGGSSKVYEVFDSSNRSTKAVKQVRKRHFYLKFL